MLKPRFASRTIVRVATGMAAALALALIAPHLRAALVDNVRASINKGDFAAADRQIEAARKTKGASPELAEAISWEARGALTARKLDQAQAYANKARDLALQLLKQRKLDSNPSLATALGASIEVEAKIMAAHGETSSAVAFLKRELQTYRATSIAERIAKNINLLSMEGKPAPLLDAKEWIGAKPPTLASLRGKPVLLFFWAHWCPDCKNEAPILAKLLAKYQSQGLSIIAPTQRYGYVAGGKPASPDEELKYIVEMRDTVYSFLKDMPVPMSVANHERYGVSTTPTVVIVDRQGAVRLYHPGQMTEAELETQLRPLLAATSSAAAGQQ